MLNPALRYVGGLALLVGALPLRAEIPAPVKTMIEEAIRQDNAATVDAVVKIARTTNPDAASEIDALHQAYRDHRAKLTAAKRDREIRELRQAGPFKRWKGKGELGAFRATGNTSNIGIALGLSAERKGIDWEHRVQARFDYQKNAASEREQYLLGYRPRLKLVGEQFAYALAQFESDKLHGFDARYSLSGGLGYHVIEQDNLKLALEAGPAWRRTDFTTGVTEDRLSGLGSLDFEWRLAEALKVTQDANAYVEAHKSTFNLVTAIEAGVTSGLVTRLSYSVKHETRPQPRAMRTDTLSRFTMVYGF